ncbi:uncharacterized protein RJT20DRAFT_15748 [Scheffersomyces xylosifermentans]|uniref:uncharacterized protein n=1 Tax=Scheffersomyces xylosifermentans TaxID=1304137 RepID=UPI00315DF271
MPPNLRLKGPSLSSDLVSVRSELSIEGSSQSHSMNVVIRLPSEVLSKATEEWPSGVSKQPDSQPQIQNQIVNKPIKTNSGNTSVDDDDEIEDDDEDSDTIIRSKHTVPTVPTTFEDESDNPFSSDGDDILLDSELNKAIDTVLGIKKSNGKSNNKGIPTITSVVPSIEETNSNREKFQPLRSSQRIKDKVAMFQVNEVVPSAPVQETKVNFKTEPKSFSLDPSSDEYKQVPKNILPMIERELGDLNDDFAVVDKIVFSLMDPLGASRIKLPVKSNRCIHFECFDFENFCIFNKIPPGIQKVIKKDLSKKNYQKLVEAKMKDQNKSKPDNDYITIISDPKAYTARFIAPVSPIYKCPLCDRAFPLHELSISDAYNYFVKTTPKEAQRVELLDMNRFKVLVDTRASEGVEDEVIVLSSDSEDEEIIKAGKSSMSPANGYELYDIYDKYISNALNDDVETDEDDGLLDDGLDEEIVRLSNSDYGKYTRGGSSWDDPLTID